MIKLKKEIILPNIPEVLKLLGDIFKLKDGKYIIYASDQKPQRTIKQNRYLRAIDKMIAGETGDDPNSIHEDLIILHSETIITKLGIDRKMRPSEMDTRQMTNYIERVRKWSNEFLNFYIPQPDDIPDEVYIQYDLKR